jgi:hypothetical protein
MRTYGVICDATGFIAYVGHAASPVDACVRATKDAGSWGTLGAFHRSAGGQPRDSGLTWLELSVYDLTGLVEPIPNVGVEDETVMAAMTAMTEDNHIDQFIARQY